MDNQQNLQPQAPTPAQAPEPAPVTEPTTTPAATPTAPQTAGGKIPGKGPAIFSIIMASVNLLPYLVFLIIPAVAVTVSILYFIAIPLIIFHFISNIAALIAGIIASSKMKKAGEAIAAKYKTLRIIAICLPICAIIATIIYIAAMASIFFTLITAIGS